jgi:hypothetical protein
MFKENQDPLRCEGNDAIQEESLGEGVCDSCTLHTKMLRSNTLKIGMSRRRSSHIELLVTMNEKY